MGMYDYIRCKMPLPVDIEGDHSEHLFQTKSLSCELDSLEIREDGTLWRESYDTEDQSDSNAEGIERIVGMCTRVNPQWERLAGFTGEVVFYDFLAGIVKDQGPSPGWIEFSAYFVKGELKHLELLECEPIQ